MPADRRDVCRLSPRYRLVPGKSNHSAEADGGLTISRAPSRCGMDTTRPSARRVGVMVLWSGGFRQLGFGPSRTESREAVRPRPGRQQSSRQGSRSLKQPVASCGLATMSNTVCEESSIPGSTSGPGEPSSTAPASGHLDGPQTCHSNDGKRHPVSSSRPSPKFSAVWPDRISSGWAVSVWSGWLSTASRG